MTSSHKFRGIIPVITTAFDESGEVLEQPIRNLVDFVIEQGAHGVAGCGEGSDFHKLALSERLRLTEIITAQVNGRAPVMIGTTANNVPEAIILTRAAAHNGADAAFVMPPYVGHPRDEEVLDHFRRIADAVDIDLVVQDNLMPGGGGSLSITAMAQLVDELPSVRYIKEETTPTGPRISRIVQDLGDRVDVISGNGGATLLNDLARGAVGCMPGSIPVLGLVRVYQAWMHDDKGLGYELFERISQLIAFSAEHYGPATREVLRRKGLFPSGSARAPSAPPLDQADDFELTMLLTRAVGLV